ncbi:MAG: tetratricopeptide repeat protein [Paraglaciecola sp.]|uniref:tetratricopeptide repeat protein n=1 Tax=Paraglaciecola sp. TaxID=1920173 RepID=UPI00329A230F
MYLCGQTSFAAERWKIVVLPDKTYHTPTELPRTANIHSTISQALTTALGNADFDVLNLHYLDLPNCMLEDCSTLTDRAIRQGAKRSGKEVNLALLYQLNAFKQRQAITQKWYFSLSGRLLDLQSGAQQDAFAVDIWVMTPAKNCIADCLSSWLQQNLGLLAQDLGAVLSEKLAALPRRFDYQLNLNHFTSAQLQQIDDYLKNLQGYVADVLLGDIPSENQDLNQEVALNINRSYQYTSELSASELGTQLANLDNHATLALQFEYNNLQRQFTISPKEHSDSWDTLNEFFSGLFNQPPQQEPQLPESDSAKAEPDALEEPQLETDEEKQARLDQQTWVQAKGVNTLESYQQYLNLWPQGQHFMEAQAAIKGFQDDENSWQQTLTLNTIQGFQQYLGGKPNGKYRNQAKQQLTRLRQRQQLLLKQQENKALADDYYHQHQNYPEALYYYEQGANLGDASSQYLLGKMYENAKGTQKNLRQAANWYALAGEQGHIKAQATLGLMYSTGKGINQNYAQAAFWYKKAAEQGHKEAQRNLAYQYTYGQGIVKNYQQAAYWYDKAAIQGDADAQNSLGKLYERGLGVNKNLTKAKSLYQQAADQGNQIARINLQMLKH